MIQKKVCLVGAFSVGKTSLVSRYVQGIFSDKYITTVGVKIDRKEIETPQGPVRLLLWDLHGEDDFQQVRSSYFRGASGFIIVADGTRVATVDTALGLKKRAEEELGGSVPSIILLNKGDLKDEWEVSGRHLEGDRDPGCLVLRASAKTGEGVEEAFSVLSQGMMRGS